MKKLCTTIALATAVTCSASAFTPEVSAPSIADRLTRIEKSEELILSPVAHLESADPVSSPAKAAPAGEWTDLGQGIWREGVFSMFSSVPAGMKWDVTIQESASTPGYFRVAPYTDDCPMAEIMKSGDPAAIFYINATDPSRVYIDGTVVAWSTYNIRQKTVENDWTLDAPLYGTLSDGVISFPPASFVLNINGQNGTYVTNALADFAIAMPGADFRDYTLTLSAPVCADADEVPVDMTVGPDIASLRYVLMKGYYSAAGNNAEVVAQEGKEVPISTSNLAIPMADKQGLQSLLMVGLNSEGKVVANATVRTFGMHDNPADWENCGTGRFTEAYFSSIFTDIKAEELSVTIERHKTRPGYYRVAEPFSSHSILSNSAIKHSSHTHYMYIDASDPDRVFIEASPTGIASGSQGESFIYSWAGYYVEAGMVDQAVKFGFFGSLKNGVITMPDEMLMIAFNRTNDGDAITAGKNFALTLPTDQNGIDDIELTDTADVELFNLQGVRIQSPTPGIYLRRNGARVEKVIVK